MRYSMGGARRSASGKMFVHVNKRNHMPCAACIRCGVQWIHVTGFASSYACARASVRAESRACVHWAVANQHDQHSSLRHALQHGRRPKNSFWLKVHTCEQVRLYAMCCLHKIWRAMGSCDWLCKFICIRMGIGTCSQSRIRSPTRSTLVVDSSLEL